MNRTIGLSIALVGLLVGIASTAPPTAPESPPAIAVASEAPTLDVALTPVVEVEATAPAAEITTALTQLAPREATAPAIALVARYQSERIERHRTGTRVAKAHTTRDAPSPSNPPRSSAQWGHRLSAART